MPGLHSGRYSGVFKMFWISSWMSPDLSSLVIGTQFDLGVIVESSSPPFLTTTGLMCLVHLFGKVRRSQYNGLRNLRPSSMSR
ncbi:hypothetical protein NPIL_146381 [Nephila pilipes]|uniref:Uncharacterized protein n=1 Tax=Nephila pilipes TaxID=299642 RepID=A0A8X6Q8D5_NEPPI|nr:hypothetical protein NPIL_146381 [Nephila pilipes]